MLITNLSHLILYLKIPQSQFLDTLPLNFSLLVERLKSHANLKRLYFKII